MKIPKQFAAVAERVDATFKKHRVHLTLGGEPTYVPNNPIGAEWTITALGPTKLKYAYTLAEILIAQELHRAVTIYSPGKWYPGEVNPRWALNLLWKHDGTALVPALAKRAVRGKPADAAAFEIVKKSLLTQLRLASTWLRGIDLKDETRPVAVLPLDHPEKAFISEDWLLDGTVELLATDGPAGLCLPLNSLPEDVSRRALTLEILDGRLHAFLPPLPQAPFLALIEKITVAVGKAGLQPVIFSGYVPSDTAGVWSKLGIASDPGVLEINLPPCPAWKDYARWMELLEKTCAKAGLRSFKRHSPEEEAGTGGGNHLLFGGPSLDKNPLFTHPQWVTSILRYWQHHPSLSYLFTGIYVGPSSQAPRPDECASSLYDLEMAYRFLEQLPPGDHRYLISETLRHLHTDTSGNTHRSEISFDKFWNVSFDGGCRGLVEFRAVESLPHALWMSAIALLWHSLAAYLLEHPFQEPLIDHGDRIHDHFFLPSRLWADFAQVLADLKAAGFPLPAKVFREITAWRFPTMLEYASGDATLTVRKAHEGWPLLCETPLEGGNTSRFVDTSIERLEFLANPAFAEGSVIRVQGRELALRKLDDGTFGIGLRYRRTALYPSLHPGIPPHMPLLLTITGGGKTQVFRLQHDQRHFQSVPAKNAPAPVSNPCHALHADLLTCDLRIA